MEVAWRIQRPVEEEPVWEALLWEEVPGRWNLRSDVGKRTIQIEIVFPTQAEADLWRSEHGGECEPVAPPEEWEAPAEIPPPMKIRDRFFVTSERDEDALVRLRSDFPDREMLWVPAEMAFGTGAHPTTRTCLRKLCDLAPKKGDWNCLDLGTGSGILAIAAQKLGANITRAVENDAIALSVAERNSNRNDTDGIEWMESDLILEDTAFTDGPWDLILANLFSEVLVAIMPKMKNALADEGALLVSGILRTQENNVLRAAKENGLHPVDTRRIGKWVTIELRPLG